MEVAIISTITSAKTIEQLRIIFATHGFPKKIVTDNATTFTSEEFKKFMSDNGVAHVTSAPYHPSTNGLAERAVRTFKQGLQLTEGDSLQERLSKFLLRNRVTPNSTTGISPAEMLLNRHIHTRLNLLYPDIQQKVEHSQQQQKAAHDNTKPLCTFVFGDKVYAQDFSVSPCKWIPGIVSKVTGPVSYQVQTAGGEIFRRHVDQLRRKHEELFDLLSLPDTPPACAAPPQPSPPPALRRSTRTKNPPNYLGHGKTT